MTLSLFLFFASLLGLAFMIGRKLMLIGSGRIELRDAGEPHPFVPDIEKIKHVTLENAKKYEHLVLVVTIRLYVRSINAIWNWYQRARISIKYIIKKNKASLTEFEKREENKFLKMIGDYKKKVRRIKHKVKKEEENQ